MKTEKCPCNHCPYDCDDEENCAEYLQWSQKNHARQMSALTRKYNTALKRIEIQNSKLKELKKQLTKAKKYIKLLLMNCVGVYESTGKTIAELQAEAEQFLKE